MPHRGNIGGWKFQSTLPVGGATLTHLRYSCMISISIHAPRGGSDQKADVGLAAGVISIHAPRGGSDRFFPIINQTHNDFNPRSPWGERHDWTDAAARELYEFQSTLPVGGATAWQALHGEDKLFQSTLPVGGATVLVGIVSHQPNDFNPRSPWGERLVCPLVLDEFHDFNPRSPWGERHESRHLLPGAVRISIHAPRGGSDPMAAAISRALAIFQSTLPVGGATSHNNFCFQAV